ncbi:helix-turn-helix domain-containing protein [Herbiconiux sp. A18JL235]|uniref:Helix-turn-helix domain-containing protein n=1 Tax=Herbiconiux sp. A18JL235 TaxID=3152363 RepID=A0AB39BMJ2_9MICO
MKAYPARPHPAREEFARLRAEGMSCREAAARVGIHERTARDCGVDA